MSKIFRLLAKNAIIFLVLSLPLFSSSQQDIDDVYTKFSDVHNRFFEYEQDDEVFDANVHTKLQAFNQEYINKQASTIDITGLSSRARIYLLKKIINKKLGKLPKISSTENFTNASKASNGYWSKEKGKFYFTDKCRTTFKVGTFTYILAMGPTKNQKGSGSLWGLKSEFKGEPYTELFDTLENHKNHYPTIANLLMAQKKDGQPINIGIDANLPRLLNGFNLLLDYEVARRMVDNDAYSEVPILSSIHFLIKNFNSITLSLYLKGSNDLYPFQGENREGFVKSHVLPQQIQEEDISHNRSIREILKFSHKDEEDSEKTYTGTEISDGEEEDQASEEEDSSSNDEAATEEVLEKVKKININK